MLIRSGIDCKKQTVPSGYNVFLLLWKGLLSNMSNAGNVSKTRKTQTCQTKGEAGRALWVIRLGHFGFVLTYLIKAPYRSLRGNPPGGILQGDLLFCYADESFRDQMRVIHAEGSGGFLGWGTWCSTLFWAFSLSSARACSSFGSLGGSLGGIHGGDPPVGDPG